MMFNRNFLLIFYPLLIFFASLAIAGTTGKIAGVVTDAETGGGLPGANILVEGTTMGGATDVEGFYYIINIPPGLYTVRVEMIGYKTIIKTEVDVDIDHTTPLDFNIPPEAIAGEEVTVVAERPVVEVDLTASKQRITSDELELSWISTAKDAVGIQSGVNVRGGIRGGFGKDVVYYLDGMEIRDPQSNQNFMGAVNTTAVEEMEVLTGGWNSEYGQANSAIINVVSKSATEKFHGSLKYRYRPPGVYHWGRNIYSKDNYEWKIMATREYWDPNSTYTDLDGTEKQGHDGGAAWKDRTPDERLAMWKRYLNHELYGAGDLLQDYDKRATQEVEGTLYGPIISGVDFMVTGKYLHKAPRYPSFFKFGKDWNIVSRLNFRLFKSTKLSVSGIINGYNNTGTRRSGYWSSEDSQGGTTQSAPRYISAYDAQKYWPYGGSHPGGQNPGAPEYVRMYSGQAKLTHVFSPKTYLDVQLSYLRSKTQIDYQEVLKAWYNDNDGITNELGTQNIFVPENALFQIPKTITRHPEYIRHFFWSRSLSIKADFVSQLTKAHQIKAGMMFSTQYFDSEGRWGHEKNINFTDLLNDNKVRPYEGAAYIQDKMEFKGMIVNLGLRLDLFNGNKKVSDTIWDPAQIWDQHPGNRGETGLLSFDPDSPYAKKTPTQVALSPRIGISHPITSSTVMHFMYGHFNMRPPWYKITANPGFGFKPWPEEAQAEINTVGIENPRYYSGYKDWLVYYWPFYIFGNPVLDYEKIIQYEIGFDQNIAGLLGLDITLFYKDGKELTTLGVSKDRNEVDNFGTAREVEVNMFTDPDNPNKRQIGSLGKFILPMNGGYMDARGVEATLETKFLRYANFRLVYNMSYSITGKFGLQNVYREWEGKKFSRDKLHDVGNNDNGISGNTNERWNPHHTLKLLANFSTPTSFGPALSRFYPLGDWYLNVYVYYASGQKWTYHSPGDFSTEPLNQTWKPFFNSNLRLAKRIPLANGIYTELTMDINNVFNNKRLRIPSSEIDQERYMEQGLLPIHSETGEVLEWTIYDSSTRPREIFFGVRFQF